MVFFQYHILSSSVPEQLALRWSREGERPHHKYWIFHPLWLCYHVEQGFGPVSKVLSTEHKIEGGDRLCTSLSALEIICSTLNVCPALCWFQRILLTRFINIVERTHSAEQAGFDSFTKWMLSSSSRAICLFLSTDRHEQRERWGFRQCARNFVRCLFSFDNRINACYWWIHNVRYSPVASSSCVDRWRRRCVYMTQNYRLMTFASAAECSFIFIFNVMEGFSLQ